MTAIIDRYWQPWWQFPPSQLTTPKIQWNDKWRTWWRCTMGRNFTSSSSWIRFGEEQNPEPYWLMHNFCHAVGKWSETKTKRAIAFKWEDRCSSRPFGCAREKHITILLQISSPVPGWRLKARSIVWILSRSHLRRAARHSGHGTAMMAVPSPVKREYFPSRFSVPN